MSAFVVHKAHIDYLVGAGLSREIVKYGPLRWFDAEPDESAYEEGVAIPAGSLTWYELHRQELTESTAGKVGAMLLAENQRSVNHRYAEDDWEDPYVFEEVAGPFDPVVVLKALDGFTYQACEHPEWRKSEARAFVQSLKDAAIGALPGYENGRGWAFGPDDARYVRRTGRRVA